MLFQCKMCGRKFDRLDMCQRHVGSEAAGRNQKTVRPHLDPDFLRGYISVLHTDDSVWKPLHSIAAPSAVSMCCCEICTPFKKSLK
jgi:hypothetical protein